MTAEFFVIGEPLEGEPPTNMRVDAARQTWFAVRNHRSFTSIEVRKYEYVDRYSELVVVDCECDRIPPNNVPGIKYRERFALFFSNKVNRPPEVRALRTGFPLTPHQNHVLNGTPSSLCLYFEPWSVIARTWTPQKHLNRILWWLEQTALEQLHRSDQPVEQLYFSTPKELVLPHDFDETVNNKEFRLALEFRPDRGNNKQTIIGLMRKSADTISDQELNTSCIALRLNPVIQGRIERFPMNLGELSDTLETRGAPFIKELFAEIRQRVEGKLLNVNDVKTMLVLNVPLLKEAGGYIARFDNKAYFLPISLEEIGFMGGVLEKHENQYLVRYDLGVPVAQSDTWRSVELEPIDVLHSFTPEYARQTSGILSSGPKGVIAGIGALGSEIFNLWSRSGWGEWTLIDPDHVKPHNLARHTVFESLVGHNKAIAVRCLDEAIWGGTRSKTKAIPKCATDFDSTEVLDALKNATLAIDVTTTLDYPREHASRNDFPRGISVFLTPNGNGCALLAEDVCRSVRLDGIEAQYYRGILNQPWGEAHLDGNKSHLWTGGGCRDLSAVISGELVALHAGNLSRQIRHTSDNPSAAIKVWHYDLESGAVATDAIPVHPVYKHKLNDLSVVWDEGLRLKVRELRLQALPSETGGVLLGYFDLTQKNIYVVDILPAPPDSQGDANGFSRGTEGLAKAIREVQRRTANIVGYLGEWHSHPPGSSATASSADALQLAHLGIELHRDGLPALMLIIGEKDECWHYASVKEE
jgi:integrative and conjugative element protein (TIGR02256 family)